MKISIHSAANKGEKGKEIIWLQVLEETNLRRYIISDTTFTDKNEISNEVQHMFWFPNINVKKGDWIALHTENGVYAAVNNDQKTITHHIYRNIDRTIWNKDGDYAILYELADSEHKKV